MKKKFNIIFLLICSIIYVASFAIIAILIDEKPQYFWLVISLTYIPNIAAMIFTVAFTAGSKRDDVILFGPLFYVFIVGNAVTFATMFLLIFNAFTLITGDMLAPLKLLVIIYIIELVIYLLAFIYVAFGVSHIRSNLKHTRAKVSFIRQMTSTVDYIATLSDNPETVKSLKALSEQIRFSDPMSHESLSALEGDISAMISELEDLVATDQEKTQELVEKIMRKLKFRNQQCLILK